MINSFINKEDIGQLCNHGIIPSSWNNWYKKNKSNSDAMDALNYAYGCLQKLDVACNILHEETGKSTPNIAEYLLRSTMHDHDISHRTGLYTCKPVTTAWIMESKPQDRNTLASSMALLAIGVAEKYKITYKPPIMIDLRDKNPLIIHGYENSGGK